MTVYITATTDPFAELADSSRTRPPQINVRRPLRGISIKEDTYAVLRVKKADGEDIPVFDSSSPEFGDDGIGHSAYYSNFIIQAYQDQRVEKQQIVQTFGEDYIFFFGEQPRFVNVSGVLLNTKDFNWKNEFLENYERYLRGTRLVENNARLYMYFDDVVIEGYLVSSTVQQVSDQPYLVQFQFQMFVCQYATISSVGSVFFQEAPTVDGSLDGGGLAPETSAASADAAAAAGRAGSPGGLNGFLATSGRLSNDATFSVQRTLEQVRNTFFGRQIVVPEGAGTAIRPPPIENRANFDSSLNTGQAIYDNYDEYPERSPQRDAPEFDQKELERVNSLLVLQKPEELEQKAREAFARAGIDTTRRTTTQLLLGRGAYAALQYMATFGIRQAEGEINAAGLAADVVNNF